MINHLRWGTMHRQLTEDYGFEFTQLTRGAQGMVLGDVVAYMEDGTSYDDWKKMGRGPLRQFAKQLVQMHADWGVEA